MRHIYSFDFVRFNCINKKKEVEQIVNENRLSEFCFEQKVKNAYQAPKKKGYQTRIDIRRPRPEFFHKISMINNLVAALTYIEIAEDLICNNAAEANAIFHEQETKIYLTYGNGSQRRFRIKGIPDGFISEETNYYGKYRKFQLVMYPRFAKEYPHPPVLRKEFRIWSAKNIMKKLKIDNLKKMPEPKEIYEFLAGTFLRFGKLNQRKIDSLMRVRGKSFNIVNTCHFQEFLCREKMFLRKRSHLESVKQHNERYKKRLEYQLSYFLE